MMTEDQKTRLQEEYRELRGRIDRLEVFVDDAALDNAMTETHYRLLRIQQFAMCAYEGALRLRMEDLGIEGLS